MDVWIFHGWTCQCEGEFLAEEATRADSSGQNLRLLRQNGSGPEHTQIYPEESCKTSLPERNKHPGVCGVFVLNTRSTFEQLNGDTCLFCVTSHPSSKLSTINPKLAITIHRVIYFGLDWQLVHHVLWCLMRITPPHSTATLILLHFIAILLKGNVHTHIIYIYTYYYILLHIITYYYILLHSYYNILVTYYYIYYYYNIITYYYHIHIYTYKSLEEIVIILLYHILSHTYYMSYSQNLG